MKITKKQLENLKLGRVIGVKRPNSGFKKGNIPWNKNKKGIHLSPKTELKNGDFIPHSDPNCKCFRCTGIPWNKGKKYKDITKHPSWKGGRILHQGKYWLVKVKDHPRSDRNGYVREHRLVVEKYLGRFLKKSELIHHINGNKADNRIENLEVVTRSEHIKMHHKKILEARWK